MNDHPSKVTKILKYANKSGKALSINSKILNLLAINIPKNSRKPCDSLTFSATFLQLM